MSKCTIENLLAEKRAGLESASSSGNDASFSTQSPVSHYSTSNDEIEKMANLLRSADVIEDQQPSFNERIAAAMILNDVISSIVKEAQSSAEESKDDKSEEEDKKEEKKDEDEKVAAFVKNAKAQGYSDEEVSDFLEKQAKIKPDTLKKVLKATATAAGIGGVGFAGHEVGKKKGKKEVAEKASKVIPAFYRAGVLKGYRAGLARASAQGKE